MIRLYHALIIFPTETVFTRCRSIFLIGVMVGRFCAVIVFVVSFTVIDSGDCGEQQVYSEMASLDVCF